MPICQIKGCTMVGIWLPRIVVWAKNYRGDPAMAVIELPHCELHKRIVNLHDLVPEENWKVVETMFAAQRKEKPDRRLTKLEWIPYDEWMKNVQGPFSP